MTSEETQQGKELARVLSKGFGEAMRGENLAGTWPIMELEEMETEFNLLPANDEEQRKLLLNRFFNANIIFYIIIGEFTLPSKYAHQKDIQNKQIDAMNKAELMSKYLGQFSRIHFGPAGKEKDRLHDEHVKTFLYLQIPPPYQRKYVNEPTLLASLRKCEGSEIKFEINIEHLVTTPGFCRCCAGITHRETL